MKPKSLLKETYNTRYISLSGKASLLIRSDKIDLCSKETIAFLSEHGIKTIIDFRDLSNKKTNPYLDLYGIKLKNVQMSFSKDKENFLKSHESGFDCFDYYVYLLTRFDRIKDVFTKILDSTGGILINCSVGRDRTGVLSFLIEMIADFDKEYIANDMAISDTNLAAKGDNGKLQPFLSFEDAKKRALNLYDWVMKEFGGISQYISLVFNNKNYFKPLKKRIINLVGNN